MIATHHLTTILPEKLSELARAELERFQAALQRLNSWDEAGIATFSWPEAARHIYQDDGENALQHVDNHFGWSEEVSDEAAQAAATELVDSLEALQRAFRLVTTVAEDHSASWLSLLPAAFNEEPDGPAGPAIWVVEGVYDEPPVTPAGKNFLADLIHLTVEEPVSD